MQTETANPVDSIRQVPSIRSVAHAMICLLFDIDGTLLLSGGAGRHAMTQVMVEMHAVNELPRLTVHGRTDRAIIEDLYRALGLALDEDTYREFARRYHDLLGNSMRRCRGELLQGVATTLDRLAQCPTAACGLLTGNSSEAAAIKVNHFQIQTHFRFGGYGNQHACRNDVAREALRNLRMWAQANMHSPDQVWVVGDTVSDITCARAIGANVIAVATGGSSFAELADAKPDWLINNMTDVRPFQQLFGDSFLATA